MLDPTVKEGKSFHQGLHITPGGGNPSTVEVTESKGEILPPLKRAYDIQDTFSDDMPGSTGGKSFHRRPEFVGWEGNSFHHRPEFTMQEGEILPPSR
jgi:hypothetical protein